MKFTTREDVEAPIERVFAEISDFDGFERAALRRGAEIARTDDLAGKRTGLSWSAKFLFRNRRREADLKLIQYDAPHAMRLAGASAGLDMDLMIDLVALSRRRTRMNVAAELRPKTISARLLVQSMKLAKSNLEARFRKRVVIYARGIEDRLG